MTRLTGDLTRRTTLKIGGASAALALLTPFAWAQGKSGLHGLSIFGELKYGPDFKHFDYIDQSARKGGTIRFQPPNWQFNQNTQTYNTLNSFVLKGDSPPRMELLFDTLMTRATDEADAVYGLLAESVAVSEDRNIFTFSLRREARFHDGSPVTAEDVAFSLNLLKEKGHPNITQIVRELSEANAIDAATVELKLSGKQSRDLIFTLVSLPVFSKAYYSANNFEASTLEPPLGSGPYKVGTVDVGRAIIFERDSNYWGRDLPVNVGFNNFDRIRIDFFRDRQTGFEAFKKGEVTYREEFTSKAWATEYDFPAIEDGKVKKELLPTEALADIQAWYPNGRRAKFSDPRTRQAIGLCFDFEWTNRNIFFNAYQRGISYFENSEFAAMGSPSAEELALLEPFRDQLPEAVFAPPAPIPKSNSSGRDRVLLRQASDLLHEVGWRSRGGMLADENGEIFTAEFLINDDVSSRFLTPFVSNLNLVGVEASIRLVDSAQYQSRVDAFDFDIIMSRRRLSATPLDSLSLMYGSEAADTPGSNNWAGIMNPVLDALIAQLASVDSRAELVTLLRAMDRILRAGYYAIPNWTLASHRVAHWDIFGRPDTKPDYSFTPETTWWFEDAKAATIGITG